MLHLEEQLLEGQPPSELGLAQIALTRVAERVTASYAREYPDSSYVSVRLGNVLGGRGSVLTAFADQISRGGPLTVTHPRSRATS